MCSLGAVSRNQLLVESCAARHPANAHSHRERLSRRKHTFTSAMTCGSCIAFPMPESASCHAPCSQGASQQTEHAHALPQRGQASTVCVVLQQTKRLLIE